MRPSVEPVGAVLPLPPQRTTPPGRAVPTAADHLVAPGEQASAVTASSSARPGGSRRRRSRENGGARDRRIVLAIVVAVGVYSQQGALEATTARSERGARMAPMPRPICSWMSPWSRRTGPPTRARDGGGPPGNRGTARTSRSAGAGVQLKAAGPVRGRQARVALAHGSGGRYRLCRQLYS